MITTSTIVTSATTSPTTASTTINVTRLAPAITTTPTISMIKS
jgi:hypothetical protein